jgi:hypothetical protein
MTTTNQDLVAYFDYLCIAREKLFRWIREQPAEVYTRSFPVGLGSIRATFLHIAGAQYAYSYCLDGKASDSAENPFTVENLPDFEPLAVAWTEANAYTRRVLADFDRDRRIEWEPLNQLLPLRVIRHRLYPSRSAIVPRGASPRAGDDHAEARWREGGEPGLRSADDGDDAGLNGCRTRNLLAYMGRRHSR